MEIGEEKKLYHCAMKGWIEYFFMVRIFNFIINNASDGGW